MKMNRRSGDSFVRGAEQRKLGADGNGLSSKSLFRIYPKAIKSGKIVPKKEGITMRKC